MFSRPKTLATAVIAGLCATATAAIAIPAISAPRKVSGNATAPSLAQRAFNLAKAADNRSKLALRRAKPGANGATGAQGAQGPAGVSGRDGTNGTNGSNGANSTVPGPQGAPGSTLKPLITGGPLTSGTGVATTTQVPFTQTANRAYTAVAGLDITPPDSAVCTGGPGPGIQVEAFIDVQDIEHRLFTKQFAAAASPSPIAVQTLPAVLVRTPSDTPHNLIVTALDGCNAGHGSVSIRLDVVEFAPAP